MIYFLCYPSNNESKIKVIDLENCVDYEIDEWARVDRETFSSRDAAIMHARSFAFIHGKEYVLFESRYDKETNEYLGEFDDVPGDNRPSTSDDFLERVLVRVPEKEWERMFAEIKDGEIDNVGRIRIRLFRMLRGDFNE